MSKMDMFISNKYEIKPRDFINLTEGSKMEISDKVVSTLYKSALAKSDSIDYGDIPQSKGDITRLKEYKLLTESITSLETILGNNSIELNVVKDSLKIVQAYNREFSLCFLQNKNMGILLYNSIVLSIICGVDICIAMSIDYLRTPGLSIETSASTQRKLKPKSSLLIDNLMKFNESANSGELKKFMSSIITKEQFIGVVAAAGAGLAGIALLSAMVIVPIIRELIYFFYDLRMRMAEYFRLQEEFLQINITELQAGNNANKAAIIKKQEKRIKSLEKLANKFEVEFNETNKKTSASVSKKVDDNDINSTLGNDFTLV